MAPIIGTKNKRSPNGHFVTSVEIEAIISMCNEGMSAHNIGRAINRPGRTVARIIKKNGMSTGFRRITQKEKDDAIFLYLFSFSITEIARELGYCEHVISRVIAESGNRKVEPFRFRKTLKPDDDAEIARRYESGEPVASISESYEMPRHAIQGAIRRGGGTLRPHHEAHANAGIYRSAKQQGIRFCEWKDYVTPKKKRARTTSAYKEWQSAVFKADDYTCLLCKERGGKLSAHHILTFAKHEDKRYDTDNGVTVCTNCHYKVNHREHLYEQQFLEHVAQRKQNAKL